MFDKLDFIEGRFAELNKSVSDPEVIADNALWSKLCKELSDITPIVEEYRKYKKAKYDIAEAKEILSGSDKELKELAELTIEESKEIISESENNLKILLLPKDPNDDKNVIVEIRAGAGGDEAALFAYVLYRMYSMYAESNRFKTELLDCNETGLGGFKEVVFQVSGKGAYSKLKFESGVHRVQRVPDTESSGRIHTSTVTVAVLPEADDNVDIEINPADLRIDVYRASGAGGQHVNKTESAVRITHMPTGIVVACQSERSQHQNKDAAMKVLRTKLYEEQERKKFEELASERKSQVGTGDRSERIRTYNYPQGRVTDHRIGLTLHKLEQILNGDITELIEALTAADQSEKLKNNEN